MSGVFVVPIESLFSNAPCSAVSLRLGICKLVVPHELSHHATNLISNRVDEHWGPRSAEHGAGCHVAALVRRLGFR
jgi:hypothetical protein